MPETNVMNRTTVTKFKTEVRAMDGHLLSLYQRASQRQSKLILQVKATIVRVFEKLHLDDEDMAMRILMENDDEGDVETIQEAQSSSSCTTTVMHHPRMQMQSKVYVLVQPPPGDDNREKKNDNHEDPLDNPEMIANKSSIATGHPEYVAIGTVNDVFRKERERRRQGSITSSASSRAPASNFASPIEGDEDNGKEEDDGPPPQYFLATDYFFAAGTASIRLG